MCKAETGSEKISQVDFTLRDKLMYNETTVQICTTLIESLQYRFTHFAVNDT